jgi:hypothetical protein
MKLMGAIRLFEISGITPAARGACAALCAELQDGAWLDAAAVTAAFPGARWEEHRLVIALDEKFCAVVAFNFESGIVLIEFAGRRADRAGSRQSRRRAAT